MHSQWDLIVVGAGSAGAALAARAVEHGQRVLLLEAGPDYRSADMPEVWRSPNPAPALMDPNLRDALAWPDLDATRTDGQGAQLYWRGRGVGGSSAINGQIAVRPPMEDFDDWASAGCTSWSPADVLPYFNRLEDDTDFGSEPYHGDGGPVPICRTPADQWGPVDDALRDAALTAGFAWTQDVNAPGATGLSPFPINSRNARRVSTNDAYLEPARTLSNLRIRGDAFVTRVVLDGRRAVGVEVRDDRGTSTEYGAEVVLSAGAVHSPAILMRSGIGPADELRALGIDVHVDLPVGEGLQDHPAAMIRLALTDEAGRWPLHGRHTNCCIRFTSGASDSQWNDLMLASVNKDVFGYQYANLDASLGALCVWLNQTHSRGKVRLVSADPAVQPTLQMRMLSDPRDQVRMREAVRRTVDLTQEPALRRITAAPLADVMPELHAALDGGNDALDAYLLASVADGQHATSTCRMGSPDDPNAVVDTDCRVLGIGALRVVDASIFPAVPRANTNLAAIMAGELMADRIGGR